MVSDEFLTDEVLEKLPLFCVLFSEEKKNRDFSPQNLAFISFLSGRLSNPDAFPKKFRRERGKGEQHNRGPARADFEAGIRGPKGR